jgi:hypothetical protein
MNSTIVPVAIADPGDAQRFLAVLAQDGIFTFQTFDDTPAKRKGLIKVLHGSWDQHGAALTKLNAMGAGIFVMVNAGDCKGRKTGNVQAVRVLFVDLDGAPLEPVLHAPIAPHMIVETSPGRWHAFWLVHDVPLADFSHLQTQLAKMFDADSSVKDLPRVMRVPGFLHQKGQPVQSKLIHVSEGPSIAVQDFVQAFGISRLVPVGERNSTLFKNASGFKRAGIPKDSAMARIAKMNHARTAVPLSESEVALVVDNAYRYPAKGFSMVPHAIIDSEQYVNLSSAAAKLLLIAMRRHRPSKDFALPHSEFKDTVGLKNRLQFRGAIKELIKAGFLVMTRDYVASAVEVERRCALYRIADLVLNALASREEV